MNEWINLSEISWKELITLSAAILGAVLGILNTWNTISQKRVKLRIRPSHAIPVPTGPNMFCIEIINFSNFPVTITEVGFTDKLGHINRSKRLAVSLPLIIDGKPWPRRLESREAVSAYCELAKLRSLKPLIGKAYAKTSCGEVAYGISPALKQLREELVAN